MGGRWRTGARALCGRTAVAVLTATIGCFGFLLAPSPAQAQAVTGTLLGNVTDSSGAGVPGATVTALETQTNTSRTAVTNESGNYIFSSLQNGTYTVDVELQGFKKVVRPNVKLDVNTTVRVDLKLEVGQLNETLTVSAETPLAPDRPDGHRAHPRVEDGVGAAAHLQPQLPVADAHRAGRHAAAPRALAVLQLAGLAALRGQRPAGDGEQHADRRARRQPEDRAAAGHHPGGRRARDRQRDDQQLRRGVRALGRRGHERDAQVRHQRSEGQRVLLRQQRLDQCQRLPDAPEGADQVRQRRLHAGRADRQEQAVLLRRLPAHGRQQRLRRPSDRSDAEDAQRRFQRGDQRHLRSGNRRVDGAGRSGVREQPDSADAHQPDRPPAAGIHSRAEHRGSRSARTTSSRRRRARRPPTGSTPRSATRPAPRTRSRTV